MQFWTIAFAASLTLAIWGTNLSPSFAFDQAEATTQAGWSATPIRNPLTP